MTIILIAAAACLLLGGVFFWLNQNTPVQTCIPAFFAAPWLGPANLCRRHGDMTTPNARSE